MIPDFNPDVVITDFEKASINGFQMAFPQIRLSRYLFHLAQNIHRKIRSLGIAVIYSQDENVQLFPFVKKEKLEGLFMFLKSRDGFPKELDPLYGYFFDNYIGTVNQQRAGVVNFPNQIWNCIHNMLEDLPRTNNAIEGWHSAFDSSFGN